MKKNILFLLLAALLLLPGCDSDTEYNNSRRDNFEDLWRIMDQNYCFFELKGVDWDAIHDKYSVLITDTMSQDSLFNVMGDMLAELKDGHTNLISSFNVSRYWSWYEEYAPNYYEDIRDNYLGTDYRIAGGMKYRKLAEGRVGYIYYGSFASGVSETNLDYILSYFKDCKALIIDVRDNSGGMLNYSDQIASRFVKEKTLTGYMSHKTGHGHNDFSKPYPMYISPSDRVQWLRPVIVLTNRRCYSATNAFVQTMRMLPNVTIMGDRTGGGSGFPFNSELPNGWSVRFSACPMYDSEMNCTEFGIDPDIPVSMTMSDILKGYDTIIDTAIRTSLGL